ncbi:hypothetical protein BRADI_4g30753v3, partial [Brachypodium distachyon]
KAITRKRNPNLNPNIQTPSTPISTRSSGRRGSPPLPTRLVVLGRPSRSRRFASFRYWQYKGNGSFVLMIYVLMMYFRFVMCPTELINRELRWPVLLLFSVLHLEVFVKFYDAW